MRSSITKRHCVFLSIVSSLTGAATFGQTIVQSTWVGLSNSGSDVWSNAARWNPQQVPNNFGSTEYDVTVFGPESQLGNGNLGPSLEGAVTLRNLNLLDGGGMSNNVAAPADLTVTGTTQLTEYSGASQYFGGMEVRNSTYSLGTFVNGANHVLTGGVYRIEGFLAQPAVLQWKGADIVENRAEELSLYEVALVKDELTGQSGLRNLAVNSGGFSLQTGPGGGPQFSTAGNFSNTGNLEIAVAAPVPNEARMTVNGALTNTGTIRLNNGKMIVTGDMSNSGEIVFTGPGARLTVGGVLHQTSGALNLGSGTFEDFRATAARIDMAAGTTLGGTGTMFCDLVGRGVLSPGNSPGKITVNGDITMVPTTETIIELAGTGAGTDFDQIAQVTQPGGSGIALDGTLDLQRLGGYVPNPEDRFTIITGGAIVGRFASITGQNMGSNRFLAVAYQQNRVVVGRAIPGDASLDGKTDIGDFSLLAAHFNQSGYNWTGGDFNGNGSVEIGDFALMAANFNRSLLDAPRGSPVPEPAAAMWTAALLSVWSGRGRRGAGRHRV